MPYLTSDFGLSCPSEIEKFLENTPQARASSEEGLAEEKAAASTRGHARRKFQEVAETGQGCMLSAGKRRFPSLLAQRTLWHLAGPLNRQSQGDGPRMN